MGAWSRHICRWIAGVVYASPLTYHDEVRYQLRIGDSRGQQAWEALSILVALRLWKHIWCSKKITLTLQGDNASALTLVLKLKAQNGSMKAIAREIALIFSESSIMPAIVEHVPGMTNVVADKLSRKFEPMAQFVLPAALEQVPEATAPIRNCDYYVVPFRAAPRKRGRK